MVCYLTGALFFTCARFLRHLLAFYAHRWLALLNRGAHRLSFQTFVVQLRMLPPGRPQLLRVRILIKVVIEVDFHYFRHALFVNLIQQEVLLLIVRIGGVFPIAHFDFVELSIHR